jgi:hypothetical protein
LARRPVTPYGAGDGGEENFQNNFQAIALVEGSGENAGASTITNRSRDGHFVLAVEKAVQGVGSGAESIHLSRELARAGAAIGAGASHFVAGDRGDDLSRLLH